MKVFLSWSGELSHKVAITFRDWLPSVIQSIVPYVSSEDIDKGARWSTDIAKELENSTFGILCVTKENVHAPWLTFEAGALSKTMEKSAVSPFLFDIKRSEVSGPILQFQSTIFEKEDIKKLLFSLNKACGSETLSDERLEKAFAVWYPTLEEQLNELFKSLPLASAADEDIVIDSASEILEEILDLTRNNQKLLRNPDGDFVKEVESIKSTLEKITKRMDLDIEPRRLRREKRMYPMFIEELLHISPRFESNLTGFQIAISLFRTDFPWLYDAGLDLVRTLRSTDPLADKKAAANAFYELVDFTFEHPIMREMYMPEKEMWIMARELPKILRRSLERYL
ncbi:MAG: TIR domain-containing protein [Acidovorax sp.]